MMLKNVMLALFCFSMVSSCFAANDESVQNIELAENSKAVQVLVNTDYIKSMEYVGEAFNSYIAARTATNIAEANAQYAVAIDNISKAVSFYKDNGEAWLLGAQIYRARGGVGYAKNYFAHAKAAFEKQLIENMANPNVKLKYAIACYASDARYLSNYDDYKKEACIAANEALKLIAAEEKSKEMPQYDLSKFLAYIILQDEQSESALALLKSRHAKDSIEYKLATEFYDDLVAQEKWLWKVSSKESAEKEFLVYCLINGSI